MPTKPLETILFRELSIAAGKQQIDLASPLLIEVINYATNVFRRCFDSSENEDDVDLALHMLYLHQIEMADGVEILISQSCPIPASLLLRSMFEANLSMEYILEDDYKNRSLSWLLYYIKDQIKISDELDPSTSVGQRFSEAKQSDVYIKDLDFSNLESIAVLKKENLESLLQKEHFLPIIEEDNSGNYRHWYSLFEGFPNLFELANHLNREIEYRILYSGWSKISHALDASRFLSHITSDDPLDFLLRNPNEINTATGFAILFLIMSTRRILAKFRPSEKWENWYIKEILESNRKLWSTIEPELK
jgi:hypothetical protein